MSNKNIQKKTKPSNKAASLSVKKAQTKPSKTPKNTQLAIPKTKDAIPKPKNEFSTDPHELQLVNEKKKAAERDMVNMIRYSEAEQRRQWEVAKAQNSTFEAYVVNPSPEDMTFAKKVLRDPAVCNKPPDPPSSEGTPSNSYHVAQPSHEDSRMQLDENSHHDNETHA
jgi:hypothetical protein